MRESVEYITEELLNLTDKNTTLYMDSRADFISTGFKRI
jgi:hypothetical protein